MLGNTFRGIPPILMRRLYQACVLPIMTYASAVWWKGKKVHEKLLTKIQNQALRVVCAAFQTTPIYAMEVEASIPPIRLRLDYITKYIAI